MVLHTQTNQNRRTMTATKRNSSVELLRILLMVFIVTHHIISSVVAPNFSNRIYACVDVFLHTAVIVFVLITGYFVLRYANRSCEEFLAYQ